MTLDVRVVIHRADRAGLERQAFLFGDVAKFAPNKARNVTKVAPNKALKSIL